MSSASARRSVTRATMVVLALASTPLAAAGGEPRAAPGAAPPTRAGIEAELHDREVAGWLTGSDRAACLAHAASFYRDRGWELAWTRDGVPTPQAHAMAKLLERAEERGLDPDDYAARRWAAGLATLRADATSGPEAVRLDVGLTLAGLRYVSDVQSGRLAPGPQRWQLDRSEPRRDPARDLERAVSAADPGMAIASVEPPFPAYVQTLHALERYRRLAREEVHGRFPFAPAPVHPGDEWSGARALAAFLAQVGDLPPASPPPRDVYEGELVAAVRRFQYRHGLEPDGVIGGETARQMGIPLATRVRQLELTLERWRWVPRSFAPPFIVVNLPEFRLHASDGAGRRLSMKVVVGRAFRWRTPVFAADLRRILFHPPWNVPRSILHAELLPKMAKDPRFLGVEAYEAVDGAGKVVSTGAAIAGQAELLRSGSLRLRQRPGPHNALGGVKFVLPNDHDVYLHGTPARRYFARSRRDLSHGCIRVEDPAALAAWVLRDAPGWSPERVTTTIQGGAPLRVDLARPVRVLIVYGTAVVTERGDVRFFEDVYRHDAALERELAERRLRSPGS